MTEDTNPRTREIDLMPTLDILNTIASEDCGVAAAVANEIPNIAALVDCAVRALGAGGRLLYVGAGTSGWLGALDAAECPGTYGTDPEMVRAIVAGGATVAPELGAAAEDDEEQGARDVEQAVVTERDVVLGISASGRTPYVIGGLTVACAHGAVTGALVAARETPLAALTDVVIAPETGPEVIAGSTRMKAATAQKLVLNMLSTATMVRLGYTYSNLMVNVRVHNQKLRARAQRIVVAATGVAPAEAEHALTLADSDVKTALVMLLADVDVTEARQRLVRAGGVVRKALI